MPMTLPRSLDRSVHTVAEEVAHARELTPEQRLALVASVCRAALYVLHLNPKREQVLQMRDPVPESTRRALKRLRAQR